MYPPLIPGKLLAAILSPIALQFTSPAPNTFPVLSFSPSSPIISHNVEISGDVAATFHIEPNHNPKAGQQTQAWFALTQKGGKTIPLNDCNCQLAVYSLPRNAKAEPLIKPVLKSINAEKYKDIPGATMSFPKAGAYELELTGTPKTTGNFKPFKFKFTVNVGNG